MDVFHVFKIAQMVPNRATPHICKKQVKCNNGIPDLKLE